MSHDLKKKCMCVFVYVPTHQDPSPTLNEVLVKQERSFFNTAVLGRKIETNYLRSCP